LHLSNKHSAKVHFIPYNYRIFGGLLQSMNIQFGNFIEKLITLILEQNTNLEIVNKYSGIKSNTFKLSNKSDVLIDNYITECQINYYSELELSKNYNDLCNIIIQNEQNENDNLMQFKHDIDVLFRYKDDTNCHYYLEIKYNDDHDTGKFVDINRKLLKTYAYLVREFGRGTKINPILFYFTNKKMKGNIYLPEKEVIFRGERFFNEFTNIKYSDIDRCLKSISEDEVTIKLFEDLYNKIVCR